MSLTLLLLIAIISYSLFEIFSSRAGGAIDANLSSLIFNGLGAVVPVAFLVFAKLQGEKMLEMTGKGLWSSIFAGVSIAVFSVVLVKLFERGGELSFVIPVIYGSSVVITAIYGAFILKDHISPLGIIGIILVAFGIGAIAVSKMDVSFA